VEAGDVSRGGIEDNQRMTSAPHSRLELRQLALEAICEPDPEVKSAMSSVLYTKYAMFSIVALIFPAPRIILPGRPESPALTHPARVPRRSPVTLDGRAAMVHAICHIEFNAINLALDALWRFDGMPDAYYQDWALVAKEEAHHFTLLRAHLQGMDAQPDGTPRWDYGSFAAHDNLWAMCAQTSDDVVARMALVPRTLEARGLDATPQIQAKLRQVGTPDALRAVDILDIILRDEVGHVAIGNHWYRWLCERDGLDPVAHYALLTERYKAPKLKPPFNEPARLRAGFTRDEILQLGA
jgi:uncharacterized ferritin-like protein (DUF455 family)